MPTKTIERCWSASDISYVAWLATYSSRLRYSLKSRDSAARLLTLPSAKLLFLML